MSDSPVFELERAFHVPPERVWWGWTDSEPLSHWYGPNVKTVIHQLDVRPGGLWLCEMNMGENSMYQRAEYTEVVPTEKTGLASLLDGQGLEHNRSPDAGLAQDPVVNAYASPGGQCYPNAVRLDAARGHGGGTRRILQSAGASGTRLDGWHAVT